MLRPNSTGNNSLLAIFLGLGLIANANAATVWTGDSATFTKSGGADSTLEENQDRLTDNVWLTRATTQGLFNINAETGFSKSDGSPIGTEWAFASINNPDDTTLVVATNFANLNFDTFSDSLSNSGGGVGENIVGRKGVLHLLSDDIYLDIEFSSWDVGRGGGDGGFSYQRSTVPLPPAMLLFLSALAGLGFTAKRRQSV